VIGSGTGCTPAVSGTFESVTGFLKLVGSDDGVGCANTGWPLDELLGFFPMVLRALFVAVSFRAVPRSTGALPAAARGLIVEEYRWGFDMVETSCAEV